VIGAAAVASRPRILAAGICALIGAALVAHGFWIPAKAAVAQVLLETAWAQARAGREARPWPWADTEPVARLSLPRLGSGWVVLSGVSGRNLAFAPALMDGSAAPGEAGLSVIAGHRDTHFAPLRAVEVGDPIDVERADGARYRFHVVSVDVVDADATRLRLDGDVPLLALVTCYPFDTAVAGGSARYVVTAARIDG
jgi:sortase A